MKQNKNEDIELGELIEVIGSMGSLDFSKRLQVPVPDSPLHIIAYGLNMLSEELEANVVRRSVLEEVNNNLERFSYTVAHDIRTPLNSAMGLINLMDYELRDRKTEQTAQYITLLRETLLRMSTMLNNILDYSKAGFSTIEYAPLSVGKIALELAGDYRGQALQIDFKPGLSDIVFNEFAFRQILGNLLNNAIKHNDKEVCCIEIDCIERPEFYELSVKDNGPGIDHESQEKMFDLFENLRSDKTDSYGIGLSIVKKIVTQADGNIWAESMDGQGTKITFTIKKR